jgi:hypothetical protein
VALGDQETPDISASLDAAGLAGVADAHSTHDLRTAPPESLVEPKNSEVLHKELAAFLWGSPAPTEEASLASLAARAVRWACERLTTGYSPRDLATAVIAIAAQAQPADAQSVAALLTAATACLELADRQENSIRQGAALDAESAKISVALVVSLAATTFPSRQPTQVVLPNHHAHPASALADFWQATSDAAPTQAARSWLRLAEMDSSEAHNAIISAASTRFCVNEQFLIMAAALTALDLGSAVHQQLTCNVAQQIALQSIDEEFAFDQRMQAQLLADQAIGRSPETAGRFERSTHQRLTALGTGIAQTPAEQLAPLLLGSLEDGLTPEDLVDTLALLRAAAYAVTSITADPEHEGPNPQVRSALTACIAADALQLCMTSTESLSVRYELALAAPLSPSASGLGSVGELWVPPFDSSGLADTLLALADADPDSAAEAATAIPPQDHESTNQAWIAIRRSVAADPSLQMQPLAQVAALERGFRSTDHPARIWFLAAAARTAADSGSHAEPLAALAEDILS